MSSSNDGFGHRQPITRERLRVLRDEANSGAGGGTGLFSGQLQAIILGVAIVGLIGTVYMTSMKDFSRALNHHWRQNVGYRGVGDASRPSGQKNEPVREAEPATSE